MNNVVTGSRTDDLIRRRQGNGTIGETRTIGETMTVAWPYPFPVPRKPVKADGDGGFVEDLLDLAIARLRRRNSRQASQAISHILAAKAALLTEGTRTMPERTVR